MLELKDKRELDKLIENFKNRKILENKNVEEIVKKIIEDVKTNGDNALNEYTLSLDKVKLDSFVLSKEVLKKAAEEVEDDFVDALKEAKGNIIAYHEKQKQNDYIFFKEDSVYLGQKVMAIENVGVYVPGGTAAYPSSVLMNVIPAKVAGVENIVMVTPPNKEGKINPYIAAAALIAEVDKVFLVGGAQAIAALAYGTETIKAVDKIVGPGNIFVAVAKKMVYGDVDIDMIAGPSEILVIADEGANPKFVAADLLSQAEHDKLAASILITVSLELYDRVKKEIEIQSELLERKEFIKESLKNHSFAIICDNINEAIEISNKIAPEHLELMIENSMDYLKDVKNAGSIFLGYNTPEPVGDYFGGTNHVLPTNSTARFFSALSVDSFVKKSSFMHYSREALEKHGKKIMLLAEKEGLTAHKNSVKVRIESYE
ncbi:MAG: histidinol dehydrogenase [Sarcina sp.]